MGSMPHLFVIIVNDVAGRDLSQVLVHALVGKQEEGVTGWGIRNSCELIFATGHFAVFVFYLKLDTGVVEAANWPIVSDIQF